MNSNAKRATAAALLIAGLVLLLFGYYYAKRGLNNLDDQSRMTPGPGWSCTTSTASTDPVQECESDMTRQLTKNTANVGQAMVGCTLFLSGTLTVIAAALVGTRSSSTGVQATTPVGGPPTGYYGQGGFPPPVH